MTFTLIALVLLVPTLGCWQNRLMKSPIAHTMMITSQPKKTILSQIDATFPISSPMAIERQASNLWLKPSTEHWLGVDQSTRDVAVRMLYGTRIALSIGVIAVSIYVTIGVFIGSMAGFFGGIVDLVGGSIH